MTDRLEETVNPAAAADALEAAHDTGGSARRPYTRPELVRLGSVRDLTLGNSGKRFDAIGTRTKQ